MYCIIRGKHHVATNRRKALDHELRQRICGARRNVPHRCSASYSPIAVPWFLANVSKTGVCAGREIERAVNVRKVSNIHHWRTDGRAGQLKSPSTGSVGLPKTLRGVKRTEKHYPIDVRHAARRSEVHGTVYSGHLNALCSAVGAVASPQGAAVRIGSAEQH